MEIDQRKKIYRRFLSITKSQQLFPTAHQLLMFIKQAWAETNSISIERVRIYLKRLPKEFDGFRIVHLSDIHHSPFTRLSYIEKVIQIANRLRPDIFALTGDYVSHDEEYIEPIAKALGKLKAKYGTYACLGNHDHWTNAKAITEAFEKANIKLLVNRGFFFELNGSKIWICGVDDYMVGKADMKSALKGSSDSDFKLLLAHNPQLLRPAARYGIDLMLSGHTHGGQIRFRNERKLIPRRLKSGLFAHKETQVYITRGIGTVVVPLRYQCPPEISLLELCSATSDANDTKSKK